jgi:UDP-N-acetylglucosamine--N-acetylmuramyl-(pentapeptide) pyrophosphoryl-undecaprenol N-acetylglucosamine transferase
VTWLGRPDSLEARLIARRGLDFVAIEAAPMVGRGPVGRLRSGLRLLAGTAAAWREAGRRRPQAVLVTGAYVCVPVALAAWLRRIPLMILLPDAAPGKAVRFLAPLARCVAVSSEQAARHFAPGKAIVAGYPVRDGIRRADRAAARAAQGIADSEAFILAFGGSQGAASINRALAEAAPALLNRAHILQISGEAGLEAARAARAALAEPARARLRIEAYLHEEEMAAALAAADLVICRAGASTLGELPASGSPAILVPLPISGGHQWPNARLLEAAGAAIVIDDGELDGQRLSREILSLLDDRPRRRRMAEASRALDRPDAAPTIWSALVTMAGGSSA